jgi:hypothetical protein
LHEHDGDADVSVELEVVAPGHADVPDGAPYRPGDGGAPRPVRYEAVPAHTPGLGLENLCNTGTGFGWWYTVTAIDNVTGAVLSQTPVCVPFTDPAVPGIPPPPALPVPPTIADIWDAVGVPAPPIGISPANEGVVGLETWMWSGGDAAVDVAVTLDGYTVTGTARRTELSFDSGDGAPPTATTEPGSFSAPAASRVYDVKETYAVRVAARWQADVTMTGPGLPAPVPIAIGTAVITSTQDYPVVEVRSVLVP